MSAPDRPPFTLFRFQLVRKPCGAPTQNREVLRGFADVETALAFAKAQAWQALCQLAGPQSSSSAAALELRVDDTEWGYDVRRNGLVVDRYWVHDASPREPA
jgi:hypothetical protein